MKQTESQSGEQAKTLGELPASNAWKGKKTISRERDLQSPSMPVRNFSELANARNIVLPVLCRTVKNKQKLWTNPFHVINSMQNTTSHSDFPGNWILPVSNSEYAVHIRSFSVPRSIYPLLLLCKFSLYDCLFTSSLVGRLRK